MQEQGIPAKAAATTDRTENSDGPALSLQSQNPQMGWCGMLVSKFEATETHNNDMRQTSNHEQKAALPCLDAGWNCAQASELQPKGTTTMEIGPAGTT